MSYIGREPQIGNFQMCDAISVVNGQAAYSMQVGGVAVIPGGNFNVIASVNGVVQKAGSSFTISSSTITFSQNLVTGDVIDFILILGSVLDLGVPSDGTVTTGKIVDSNITTQKIANNAITSEKLASGLLPTNTPAFHATMSGNQNLSNNTATKVDFDTEVFDTDSDYDTTNKRFLPTVSGKYFITFSMSLSSGASIGGVEVKLRKNGTDVYITEQAHYYGNASQTYVISGIISCNGSSDYVEAFAEQDRGSTAPIQGTVTQSFFQGYKLIGA